MFLSKKSGGATIGEYVWAKAGDVVEVADEFGRELLAITGHDFTEVPAPTVKAAPVKGAKPVPFSD